jgi:hypothetical protein
MVKYDKKVFWLEIMNDTRNPRKNNLNWPILIRQHSMVSYDIMHRIIQLQTIWMIK